MNSIGRRSCERIMEEKTPLSRKLCAFRCLNWKPQLKFRIQFKHFSEKLPGPIKGPTHNIVISVHTPLLCLFLSCIRESRLVSSGWKNDNKQTTGSCSNGFNGMLGLVKNIICFIQTKLHQYFELTHT